jgi:hypothetical protein
LAKKISNDDIITEYVRAGSRRSKLKLIQM